MLPLFREYGIADRQIQVCEMEHAEFKVQKITAAELVQGEILGQTDSQMQENFSKNGTAEKFMMRRSMRF